MKFTFTVTFVMLNYFCFSQKETAIQMTSFVKSSYRIQYPKSWILDTSGKMGTELFVFSLLENEADKFKENVNVIIQDLSGQNIDLRKYKQITEKQLTDMNAEGKVFESSILNSANGNFYKITYSMKQGAFKLKITSICFIKNEKAYLATFTSEFDKYDQYKIVGEKILNSFTLIK